MTEAWPTGTINVGVVRTSYREKTEAFIDAQQPTSGPPLERPISSIVMQLLSFEGRYTAAEKAALDTFWKTTLLKGTQPFTRAHPISGVSTLFKFEGPPEVVGAGATLYHVAMTLRTLP